MVVQGDGRSGATHGRRPHYCPISGRKLATTGRFSHDRLVSVDQRLVQHVVASTGLDAAEAARVIEDVIAFHAEPVEQYVRRRHGELKLYGARNAEIFTRLREELAARVVAAPDLSERQLRRMIYG
jgi:uncharacterized membrane protein